MFISKFTKAWTDVNSVTRTHQLIIVGLFLVILIQFVVIFSQVFSDPIVVVLKENEQIHFKGRKLDVPLSEDAVERFVRKFLKRRYVWHELNPEVIAANSSPFLSRGLNAKTKSYLKNLKNVQFQGKSVSQAINNIDISVTKEQIIASFDKLIRVEGIPMAMPTTISLRIEKGISTFANPVGLAISGIIESQSK